MRHLAALFTVCLVCTGLRAQQPASFAGSVVNLTTGAALSGVHVTLTQYDDGSIAAVYGAISGKDGSFSMAAVRPGVRYRLEAERAGFLLVPRMEQGQRGIVQLDLKTGEQVSGYRLEMAPLTVITGRVLDEKGEPAPGIMLRAQRVSQEVAKNVLPPFLASTDEMGRFRVAGPPGKYLLVTAPSYDREQPETRTDGTSETFYLATYYPQAATAEAATIVETHAGSDAAGIEIHLIAAPPLGISGLVTGIPAVEGQGLILVSSGPDPSHLSANRFVRFDKEGKFAIVPAEPGYYRITAEFHVRDRVLYSPVLELTVPGNNAESVRLALQPGFEVSGNVEGEAGQVTLSPVLLGTMMGGGFAPVQADGAFRFNSVRPNLYLVRMSGLKDGAYLKSVRLGTKEAPNGVVDLRNGSDGSALHLTVSPTGAGRVAGTLVDAAGRPIHMEGSVYLVPDGAEYDVFYTPRMQTPVDGAFAIEGIAPGKYRIFASVYGITPLPKNLASFDQAKSWAATSDMIEIHEGERLTLDLKVVGAK
jgi:hypothetical protein